MRRLTAAAAVALPLFLVPSLPAAAQDESAVRILLEEQTTTASADVPFEMRVRLVNETDETFRDLGLTFWLYPEAASRSAYAQSLEVDLPTPLKVETLPLADRALEPGEEVTVPITPRTEILEDIGESALYPIRVQLSSGLEPIATLRSSLVYLVKRPLIGLNVAATFVLDVPLVLGPRGVFADDTLERELAPGGRLRRILDVLRDLPVPVTVVVSPLLLQQLQAMVAGYRVVDEDGQGLRVVEEGAPGTKRAQRALDTIAAIARRPETELVSLPYASPSLSALANAGMTDDLEAQLARGRDATEERLGVEPPEDLTWPPASVLTEEALDGLAAAGIDELIVDAETLPPPPVTKFTPSSSARLETQAGSTFRVLTPDPGVDARLSQLPDDPRLRAQWVLGELASIFFEFPGRDRGVALVFDEDDAPEAVFLRRLLTNLFPDESPWLRAVPASRLLEPELEPPRDLRRLREPTQVGRFPPEFIEATGDARDAIAQLVSIRSDADTVDRLRELLLLSQSRYLLGDDERRLGYLERIDEIVAEEFGKIQTPAPGVVTLTSLRGEVPVTIRNLAGRDIQVEITLQSSRLEFLDGSTHTVTLSLPAQRFEFPVRAETTGRFPVHVEVRTPLGAEIAETSIVVRSTAYNRVALIVTIGAALFLLALWARRFLPRPA